MNIKIIRRGDIFLYDFGVNTGSIQNGYRPVLVVQADDFNANAPTVIVAAITSATGKRYLPSHIIIGEGLVLLLFFISKTRFFLSVFAEYFTNTDNNRFYPYIMSLSVDKKLNTQSVSKLHKRQKAEEKQFFFRLSKGTLYGILYSAVCVSDSFMPVQPENI